MTPKLAFFTLVFGIVGGLLFAWCAAVIVRRWDLPSGFRYGLGTQRQRIQEKIVLSAMVFGGLLFAAIVSMPAWAETPFVEVDFNGGDFVDEALNLDLVRFIILCIAGVAAVAFVAKAWGNRVERRKTDANGNSDRGDILLKIATKDDLQRRFEHLENSLRRALTDHDEKNERDFGALREDIANMREHIDKMVEGSNQERAKLEKRVSNLERAAKQGDN